ncbi:MAG: PEP-CTERM sorting domain-containing protein [Deltaproteobacteria bacterium]|nr:PEP-CTERM sorting domain-containing protein [Deltaproteobacteria bacterium]
MTAVGVLLMLCLAVFAFGAVDYGEKRHFDLEVSKQPRVTFSLPRIAPVIAQAGSSQPVDELPDLLPIQERFPNYRDVPKPKNPDDGNNGDEGDPFANGSETNMVILDDLRAAPPKSMFVNAIFENADSKQTNEELIIWFTEDFTDPMGDLYGHPDENVMANPPIPEPGTGVLLCLGLTAIASWRKRDLNNFAMTSPSRSSTTEGRET